MSKTVGYNGASQKESFYKIKKHYGILARRLRFSKEVKKIQSFQDKTLTLILRAYLQVKNKDFSEQDLVAFARQESYRQSLLQNPTPVSYAVFGSDKKVSIQQICERSPSPKIWAEFLYCLCKELAPQSVLEIGTNLGISGGYMLEGIGEAQNQVQVQNQAQVQSHFVSMEGLPQLCELSREHFSKISSKVEVIEGLYDTTIPELLARNIAFDTFFIDGNHQKEATISYFHSFKEKARYPAVFIFDDINHSQAMKEAWEEIKSDAAVKYSIDLFKMGIVVLEGKDSVDRHDFELFLAY